MPFTIVSRTESSVEPVGAPTTLSLVRTMVAERSRSAWSSADPRRHSVSRLAISEAPVVAAAISVTLRLVVSIAPAALVPTAPARVVSLCAELRVASVATVALLLVVPAAAEIVASVVVFSDEALGVVSAAATVVVLVAAVSRVLSAAIVAPVVLLLAAGVDDAVELLVVLGVELLKVESVVLVEPDALPDVLAVASSDFEVSVDADVPAGEALVEFA